MSHAAAAFAVSTCSYQKAYRHRSGWRMSISPRPSGLTEIGHEARPMREVISALPQKRCE